MLTQNEIVNHHQVLKINKILRAPTITITEDKTEFSVQKVLAGETRLNHAVNNPNQTNVK